MNTEGIFSTVKKCLDYSVDGQLHKIRLSPQFSFSRPVVFIMYTLQMYIYEGISKSFRTES
jgi:hypothetical protein